MKRRSFLKALGLGGAAAVALPLAKSLPTAATIPKPPPQTTGVGLAQVKAGGAKIVYDSGIVTKGYFNALWPGIDKWIKGVYDEKI